MRYLTEPAPDYGRSEEVLPGVRRIVARNPGRMTYHGTNSFLLDRTLIDPGPDDATHVAALLATGQTIDLILLTHTHADHVGALPALARATGARVAGHAIGDRRLRHGDTIAGFEAIHTPGHASDHLCFAHGDLLFTGDHVMAWSSSTVALPDGDMTQYLLSLDRVMQPSRRSFLPAHGPALHDPLPFVAGLKQHRLAREAEILAALPARVEQLVRQLYAAADPALWPAAARTVGAHLARLATDRRAREESGLWQRCSP